MAELPRLNEVTRQTRRSPEVRGLHQRRSNPGFLRQIEGSPVVVQFEGLDDLVEITAGLLDLVLHEKAIRYRYRAHKPGQHSFAEKCMSKGIDTLAIVLQGYLQRWQVEDELYVELIPPEPYFPPE